MANYTLCLQELPAVNVNDVNNIVRQLTVTNMSKKEKFFKLKISSYIDNFEGEYSLISQKNLTSESVSKIVVSVSEKINFIKVNCPIECAMRK